MPAPRYVYSPAPGKVNLLTNCRAFPWAPVSLEPQDRPNSAPARVEVRYYVGPTRTAFNDGTVRYGPFTSKNNSDRIEYHSANTGDTAPAWVVKDLLTGQPTVEASAFWHEHAHGGGPDDYTPTGVLASLFRWSLLRRNWAALPCQVLTIDGLSTALLSPPAADRPAAGSPHRQTLAGEPPHEQVAITDGRRIVPFHWFDTSAESGGPDDRTPAGWTELARRWWPRRANHRLRASGPPRRKAVPSPAPTELEPKLIDRIVLWERGTNTHMAALNRDTLRKTICNVQLAIFGDQTSGWLAAYEYFHDELDLRSTKQTEWEVISNLVESAESTWRMTAPSASQAAQLLQKQRAA